MDRAVNVRLGEPNKKGWAWVAAFISERLRRGAEREMIEKGWEETDELATGDC